MESSEAREIAFAYNSEAVSKANSAITGWKPSEEKSRIFLRAEILADQASVWHKIADAILKNKK